MDLIFNGAARDTATALVSAVSSNSQAQRPTFTLGDNALVNLYISDSFGGYDAQSGDSTVTPWLAVCTPGGEPASGTFWLSVASATSGTLTSGKRYQIETFVAGDSFTNVGAASNATGVIFTASGTTPTTWTNGSTLIEITTDIAFDASAATLEAALEATQAIVGVSVTKAGTTPEWLVQWDAVGSVSTMGSNGEALVPSSAVVTNSVRTGTSSVTAQQYVRLALNPYALQTTWTPITNGWQARLNLNTRELFDFVDGETKKLSTLEFQTVDGSGNVRTIGQVECLIRNEGINQESVTSSSFPTALTSAQTLLQCVQNRYAVTALTGGGTALDGIVTGTPAVPTVQTGSLVCIEISTILGFYELVTGTDAESSPDVIRPDDYDGSTNARVWKLRKTIANWSEAGGTYSGSEYAEWTPSSSSSNVAAIIAPKGTGPILADVPDGASSGGNNRGASAVDMQVGRGSASQVASGAASCIPGGYGNTASGTRSFASGSGCVASGDYSRSEGVDCTASGNTAAASGYQSLADLNGQRAFSGGGLGSGVAQCSQLNLATVTPDATPYALILSNGGGSIALRANTSWAFSILVIARKTGGGSNVSRWKIEGSISRDGTAGSTTLLEAESSPGAVNVAGWDCAVTADTSAGALKITVTGGAYNVAWNAHVQLSEITYA